MNGWTPQDYLAIIAAISALVGTIGGFVLTWRKLEVIRVDVNASKSLLELKLSNALDQNALRARNTAQRTGTAEDVRSAERATGAADQAAKPTTGDVAQAVEVQEHPHGAEGTRDRAAVKGSGK